jgi:predicted glycosyltransferase
MESDELKVWYDACTGKHMRYGVAIAERLRSLGHEVVLTSREHPDTVALARFLGEKAVIVGKYKPESLSSRLKSGLERQLQLCEIFEDNPPDGAISHGSIDLCRVAFGLGVSIISTADSPHATAANRLALPLIDWLVTSKALPKRLYQKFGVRNIVQFDGVDEVAWIKDFAPPKEAHEEPLIVVRQTETKAAYSREARDITLDIAQDLTALGQVIFLSRYERAPRRGLKIPSGFVDTAGLAANADLVVGVGGTIAREAALQGTPSLVIPLFGRFHANDYLANKGFPLYTCTAKQAFAYAKRHLGAKKRVAKLLEKLENPVDTIEKLVLDNDDRQVTRRRKLRSSSKAS